MFTEKAETVYKDTCCDFLCPCGIRTMPMTKTKEKLTSENNTNNNEKNIGDKRRN